MTESYSYDWFSHHVPTWSRLLGPWRGRPDLNFLEIGSFEGRSACWLLQNVLTHGTSRITCIDLFLESLEGDPVHMPEVAHPNKSFDENVAAIGAAHKVTKMAGPSFEILPQLPASSFDFVYVDGSHYAAYVLTDAVLAWRCLRLGGLVIFDDYLWGAEKLPAEDRPMAGVDAFMAGFKGHYDIVLREYQVALRKTKELEPEP